MLLADKPSIWKQRYEIFSDGVWVTAWDRSRLSTGGQFDLGAWHYEIQSNWRGSTYELITAGAVVARSQARRKAVTIEAGGLTYELRKTSMWRPDFEVWLHGRSVGWIRPRHRASAEAMAELPGLTLSLQVFVLIVVMSLWAQAAAMSMAVINSS